MNSWAISAATCLSACVAAEPLDLTVPDEVTHVAALQLLDLAASPVVAWPKGQALPVIVRSETESALLGYRAQDLELFDGATSALAEAPLRAAKACEPKLPAPIWAARWTPPADPIEIAPETLTAASSLSSDAWAASCPDLSDRTIAAQIGCLDRRCEAGVHLGAACTFELELGHCNLGLIAGKILPDGELCLDRSDAERAACPIEAHAAPDKPPFTVELRTVVEGATDVIPNFLTFNGLLLPDLLFFGWAYDLAATNDRVVIAAGDGPPRDVCRIGSTVASRLVAFDIDNFEPIATATVPPCLTRLAAFPDRDELAAIFEEQYRWKIARLALDGRVLARAPAGADFGPHRVVDLEILPEAIAALFNDAEEGGKTGDRGNVLVIYDRDTLEVRARHVYPRGNRWAMAPVGAGTLALADHRNRAIDWFHIETGTVAAPAALPRPNNLNDDSLLDIVLHDDVILAHGTRDPLVFTVEPSGVLLGRAWFFERPLDPVTSISWPLDQSLVLTTGVMLEGTSYRSFAARFDPATRRFLPGTGELGPGIAGKMVADRRGRLWALLPWSGQIARITPRQP